MKRVLLFLFFISIICCDTKDSTPDCSTVLCAAFDLYIKIIDTDTSTNYIVKNNITEDDISITNSNNEPIDFSLVSNSESPLFGSIIFLANSTNNPTLSVLNLDDINISYTVMPPTTNACCDFGSIENLSVNDFQFEFNSELNLLTISL